MYTSKDFYSSDTIAVIARGASSIHSRKVNNFEDCFLVGQFTNALKNEDMKEALKSKNIVQIVNKCTIKTDKETCKAFNILDLQCNFAPDADGSKKGSLSPGKTAVYEKIVRVNQHLKVHLGPLGIKERRVRPPKTWATTGLYAIDLAAFFQPKEILIFGVDFYESGYLARERKNVSIKSNRGRKKDMQDNLYGIARRDSKINFHIYTSSNSLKGSENLHVHKI